MATRRQAREWAVQLLFQFDLNPDETDGAFRYFWSTHKLDGNSDRVRKSREFTEGLVRGVRGRLSELDDEIRKYARNWDIRRMGVIERNVLRMALYEMTHEKDVPPVVIINEAVDIAKYFSSTESGKFVNGILDRACRESGRPARTVGDKEG